MRPLLILFILLISNLLCSKLASCQTTDSTLPVKTIPPHYLEKVEARTQSVDQALGKKTSQYLNKLARIEARLLGQLNQTDTAAANKLPMANYQQLAAQMQGPSTTLTRSATIYIPSLDTLLTTLQFLQTGQSTLNIPGNTGIAAIAGGLVHPYSLLSQSCAQVQQLQAHLDESAIIQQYISQRRQQIAQLLGQYTHLPPGVTQAFDQYKSTVYYYHQQIEQYNAILNDPQKVQQAAIRILSKLPAYQQFLAQHSLLASLFQLPAGYGSSASLQGLQTHDQVQQQLQQQVGGGGGQGVQQQLQNAESQMTNMQNNLSKYGVGGQNLDMPDFKPNTQKTKTFLKRLQYGFNIQLAKSSTYFPATGNIGLSVAYKINDNSSIGAGASYNLGLGSGWSNIQFSNQGVGLRSFIDWKIKKTYYITGGYELNHLTPFSKIPQLQDQTFWQPSALIGLEKKYRISSRLQGNLQLLYDALYKQELPPGQMIKFRVGYVWR